MNALPNIRDEFPVLETTVHGKPLVYLDNAATAQKPRCVIDAVADFYRSENANIHRGVHYLSAQATTRYDEARVRVARFLNARESREILFVRGATEAINLVANCFLKPRLQAGDEILITEMEHHANIVPWQLVAETCGAVVKVVPITSEGELDLDACDALLNERTKLFAFTHISNVLGTINPVAELVNRAKARAIPVLIDGAQSIPHGAADVQALECDFYTFSGHKVYGPDGIGVLYGKAALLESMPPYQGGGDMIEQVTFEKSTFRGIPERFEAGTPNISGAIGLGVAIDFMETLDWEVVRKMESALVEKAKEALSKMPGVTLYGPSGVRAPVLSFTMKGVHPHDIGTFLDADGIAIRVGHHCAQPLMKRLGVSATARASFALYNTMEEVDRLVASLAKVSAFFSGS